MGRRGCDRDDIAGARAALRRQRRRDRRGRSRRRLAVNQTARQRRLQDHGRRELRERRAGGHGTVRSRRRPADRQPLHQERYLRDGGDVGLSPVERRLFAYRKRRQRQCDRRGVLRVDGIPQDVLRSRLFLSARSCGTRRSVGWSIRLRRLGQRGQIRQFRRRFGQRLRRGRQRCFGQQRPLKRQCRQRGG